MSSYERALSGDYTKPEFVDENERWKGEYDYMYGRFNNINNTQSYFYGFRQAHSKIIKLEREHNAETV